MKINRTNLIKLVIAVLVMAITFLDIAVYETFGPASRGDFEYKGFTPVMMKESSKIKNGTGIPATVIKPQTGKKNLADSFSSQPISKEIAKRIIGKSFVNNKQISIEQLRFLKVSYIGFDGSEKIGEMIVNEKVATDVLKIFKELYLAKYPIEKIRLIDDYNASDEASMNDNNTSSFCYREITGGGMISLHGLGLAIDINPVQNPYIKTKGNIVEQVLPKLGIDNVKRNKNVKGLIIKGDACYEAFIERGWKWAGDWANPKDYQHFYKELN